MSEKTVPDDVPFVRKPIGPDNPRVDLPEYPGLPSKTGKSSAMIVPKRAPKKPNAEPPVDGTDAPRAAAGSELPAA